MKLSRYHKKFITVASVAVAMLLLLLLTAAGGLPGLSAKAATTEAGGGIGYYVRALLPDNQIDSGLTYFDLRMRPGQTQQLEVEVVNETDKPIAVNLGAISASTNRNGVIDYKTPDIRDKTLENPFSSIAAWENSTLSIDANATAIARVTVSMPAAPYDGVVLGGLVFTRQYPGDDTDGGMHLQNVYSYVIGVKLSETDTAVRPDFELDAVRADTVNYQPAMVHFIRNKAAAIAKNVSLHAVVRDAAGNTVAEIERRDIDMAPNSVMPLALTPLAGDSATDGGQLAPGSYTSTVTLQLDGEVWTLEQPFTIGSVEAETANAARPGAATLPAPRSGLLVTLLLVASGLILLAMVVIILLVVRRRKDKEKQARQNARRQYTQRTIYRQNPHP